MKIKLTETDLYNIIKESVKNILRENSNINNEKSIINKLNKACKKTDNDKISLSFEYFDCKYITNKFSSRFNHNPFYDKDQKIHYMARYEINGNKCYLGYTEFSGYGVSFNYLCDLTLEEFYTLFKNFSYDGGAWRRV